jgi:uncharacterized protein
VGRYGDAWKLRVAAPPEHGRANQAAVTLLAETLRIQPDDVRLLAGHGSRDKVVEVRGIAPSEAERRLSR